MLSEVSQRKTNAVHYILHMESKKKKELIKVELSGSYQVLEERWGNGRDV